MKVIESLDEWWEAVWSGKLQAREGVNWVDCEPERVLCLEIKDIHEWIHGGRYRWKPEQIKLLRCTTTLPDIPVMYVPAMYLEEGQTHRSSTSFSITIDRSETAIAEVITDGE